MGYSGRVATEFPSPNNGGSAGTFPPLFRGQALVIAHGARRGFPSEYLMNTRRLLLGLLGLLTVPAFASPPPVMMGVNLAGAEFGSGYLPGTYNTHYTYPGVAQLDYYKARGIELIRLPFKWERVQHTLYGALDTIELGRIDTFLNLAEARGMRVILDMHNYARYNIAGTTYIIGSPEVPRAAFQDVWEKLAAHVKDRDCLWAYGIMNEPYGMGAYTWKDSAQVAVNGICLHDNRHAILIPGDQYSGAHWWLTHGAPLIAITDPANNLIFEAHQYFDNDSSGKYDASYDVEGANANTGVARLTSFVDWCNANGVRGFVGEYGVPDNDPRWTTLLDNTLSYLAANNVSGTYWAGGPWWSNYALSSEMRRVGEEAPQMSVLIPRGSGVGTRYWPPYVWYKDSIASGPAGSYSYNYKSTTASLAVNFADSGSASSSYGGAAGIRFDYTVPAGGWVGAGMHITNGVNLTPNFDRGHVLTFSIKGTAGSSVRVFFTAVGGALSQKIDTAAYVTTSGGWQQVRIPLSAFVNASFTGTQRVERLSFEGLPLDNTARTVQLDTFSIEKAEGVAPVVSVSSPGGTTFLVGVPFSATATASDAGSGIDYVAFLLDGETIAIDDTAPYAATLTLSSAGDHRLTAIAYDQQGNPARSSPVALIGQTSTPLIRYALDETSGSIINLGSVGATFNLTNTGGVNGRDGLSANGGGYAAAGLAGFGTAFDVLASGDGTYHSGSSGSPVGGGLATATTVPQSSLQGATGAFTYEALVKVSGVTSEQQILSHDGSGSSRGFLFRISGGSLRLYNGAADTIATIPTSGAHGFVANQWYHVAVSYDGNEGVAGNLKFYWTARSAAVTTANLIGTGTLAADLSGTVSNLLGVGTTTRSAFRVELIGSVDEVRISDAPLGANEFPVLW